MHMGEAADLTGDDARSPWCWTVENASDGSSARQFSLSLRAGEITGVYGFMGCGQIELARALFGKVPLPAGRSLTIDGQAGAASARPRRRGAPASPICRKTGA